jgi:hypothetical protein
MSLTIAEIAARWAIILQFANRERRLWQNTGTGKLVPANRSKEIYGYERPGMKERLAQEPGIKG